MNTHTENTTDTQRYKDALSKIKRWREDNDEWCPLCGERGCHEPDCIMNEIE